MGGHKQKPMEKLGPMKSKGNHTKYERLAIQKKGRSDIPPSKHTTCNTNKKKGN